MNFVDAAVSLLTEAGTPLHVEELCRLAVERELLDSPGANPLRSFKGRLTTELKRGPDSRVLRVEDDIWALSPASDANANEGRPPSVAAPEDEPDDDLDEEEEDDDLDEDDDEDDEEDEDDLDEDDLEGEPEAAATDEPPPPRVLTAEEEELALVYGDETDTAGVGSRMEYRDALTADEDRPMTPELTAERRSSRGREGREDWKTRRERIRRERRERRDERDKRAAGRNQGQQGQRGQQGREGSPAPADGGPSVHTEHAVAGHASEPPPVLGAPPGGDLARRACEVLSSIKGAQPVPVKQLAQMMRKRRLIDDDPEKAWRPLKAALLADNQRRAAAGLPPRIHYRGRDLFAYRPSGNAELEAAEVALESATARLRGATERTLAARLADLPLQALEQMAHLYLSATGWREIDWIKRVDRSGYATAREPGDGTIVLVGVRAGNQEIDRRGVGELRAGITAKQLPRGVLLAPRELGSEARAELGRPGAPVSVLCGLAWASALAQSGVGVAQRHVPATYLDGDLLDRLAET